MRGERSLFVQQKTTKTQNKPTGSNKSVFQLREPEPDFRLNVASSLQKNVLFSFCFCFTLCFCWFLGILSVFDKKKGESWVSGGGFTISQFIVPNISSRW